MIGRIFGPRELMVVRNHLFSISDTVNVPHWLYTPTNYQEEPPPVAAYNMLGESVLQGYVSITFGWGFLDQGETTASINCCRASGTAHCIRESISGGDQSHGDDRVSYIGRRILSE